MLDGVLGSAGAPEGIGQTPTSATLILTSHMAALHPLLTRREGPPGEVGFSLDRIGARSQRGCCLRVRPCGFGFGAAPRWQSGSHASWGWGLGWDRVLCHEVAGEILRKAGGGSVAEGRGRVQRAGSWNHGEEGLGLPFLYCVPCPVFSL